jgi:hypothetical protein
MRSYFVSYVARDASRWVYGRCRWKKALQSMDDIEHIEHEIKQLNHFSGQVIILFWQQFGDPATRDCLVDPSVEYWVERDS